MRIYLNSNPTSEYDDGGNLVIKDCKGVMCCQFLHSKKVRSLFLLDNSYINDNKIKKYINILNKLDFDIKIVNEKAIVHSTSSSLHNIKGILVSIPEGPKGYVVYCFLRLTGDGFTSCELANSVIKKAGLKRKKQVILDSLLEAIIECDICPSCFTFNNIRYIDIEKWSFPNKELGCISYYNRLFEKGRRVGVVYCLVKNAYLLGNSKDCLIFNKKLFVKTKKELKANFVNLFYINKNTKNISHVRTDVNNLSKKIYEYFSKD